MPKLTRGVRFLPGSRPHYTALKFSHDTDFEARLKIWPGTRWNNDTRCWEIPTELASHAVDLARQAGKAVVGEPALARPQDTDHDVNPQLYPYQRDDVRLALTQRTYLLNYEMGLGKTPTAIEVLRLAGCKNILVICPALVRLNWEAEFKKWWPAHPGCEVVDTGKRAANGGEPYRGTVITSYELAGKLQPTTWDAIIVDEVHYCANRKTRRAKIVRRLLDDNRHALILALTATPITNRPAGLWYQLDTLWPDRFGHYMRFIDRYAEFVENPYADSGFVPAGLNKRTGEELKCRLEYMSSRVTKKEVAHLLPPCTVQTLKVKADRGFKPRELLENFVGMRDHLNDPETLIRAAGSQKVKHAVEQAELAIDSGERVCVLTHLRATAQEVAVTLQGKGHSVLVVDGDTPIKKRMALIDEAKTTGQHLVTTMHAVNVGIDLTMWTTAIFAELDYTPANMIQAIGRFSRLSGKLPSTVYVLVLEGTQDEVIASKLLDKIQDINAVIDAGHSETYLETAFQEACERTGDPFESLRRAAASMLEDDEYAG